MTTIKSYKDLRVYQSSIELLDPLYEIAYTIPHLKFFDQLIKSGEAIPPLIAEGFAKKRNPVEAARFYEISMGESDEVCVHLTKAIILSKRFKRIPKEKCRQLRNKYTSLSKQLNRLHNTQRSFSKK